MHHSRSKHEQKEIEHVVPDYQTFHRPKLQSQRVLPENCHSFNTVDLGMLSNPDPTKGSDLLHDSL